MKYLIVGLGNIGSEYENTRHNIGFKILDSLANDSGVFFSTNRLAATPTIKHKGRTFLLAKPSTFMNLSGKAVNYWMQEEKIALSNVLILTDDIALPFGVIRIKEKGSDGGHNGLKNITQLLGRNDYPRLRFGIGSEFNPGKQINYVLSDWHKEEQTQIQERIDHAKKMIFAFGTIGAGRTMSEYNNK